MSVPMTPPVVFAEWLRSNMPPGTIISDPDWWAMAIWSAARRAINAAPVASVSRVSEPDDVAKDAARYRFLKDKLNSAKAGGGIEVNSKLQLYEKPVEGEEVRFYWYPSTPIGSYEVSAGTLDEAIDFLMLAQEPTRCAPYPLHNITPEEK